MEDSHRWVMKPHTVYERRRELRVRESQHTFMLIDPKHYDCDTGKYITDKLHTINSYSLSDFVEDGDYHNYTRYYLHRGNYAGKNRYIENQKWFTPKDNDFDEECRIEKERKLKDEEEGKRIILEAREKVKQEKMAIAYQKMIDKEKESAYQLQVREAEIIVNQYNAKHDSVRHMPMMANIRPNCWRVK
jgi:hypothetical protein